MDGIKEASLALVQRQDSLFLAGGTLEEFGGFSHWSLYLCYEKKGEKEREESFVRRLTMGVRMRGNE